jgi:hypothetical protein
VDDPRRSLRWSGRLPCRLELEKEVFRGEVVDLSFGGARITNSTARLKPGSQILLVLRPDREGVELTATLVHVEDQHFGVEFQHSRQETLKALKPFFYP